MAYSDWNYSSSWRMKRFSHSSRLECSLAMLELRRNDVLLDYGGGDGHLIKLASESTQCLTYILFEPSEYIKEAQTSLASIPNITFCSNPIQLPDGMCSKMSCLEVFETSNRHPCCLP